MASKDFAPELLAAYKIDIPSGLVWKAVKKKDRHRHERGRAEPRIRAVLHHQGTWPGIRSRISQVYRVSRPAKRFRHVETGKQARVDRASTSTKPTRVKDGGGGFAMALPVAARTGDTTEPQNECDMLRMGTAGLGANKNTEQRQCPLYLFSISRSPLPRFGS